MSPPRDRLREAGEALGPYKIVAKIAHGGMGSIYAVRRTTSFGFDKLLALKVLHPQFVSERRFVDMLLDEARIAARVDHPNVVSTFDVIEEEGVPLIVMELLRGQSLYAVLASDVQPPRRLLLSMLASAAEGLSAAHEATDADGKPLMIVHRDVSPQNIHVGYDGRVKLVDFGVAAARGRIASTRTGEVKGKLAYLAPEQMMQGRIDRRTDVFALGIVLWEALTGQRLFRKEDEASTMYAILHQAIPHLRSMLPDIDPAVDRIVAQCLDRDPLCRPSSASEIAAVLLGTIESPVSPAEIAEHMRTLFTQEIAEDESRLKAAAEASASAIDVRRIEAAAQAPPTADETKNDESTSTAATGDIAPAVVQPRRSQLAPRVALIATLALSATGVAWWRVSAQSQISSATLVRLDLPRAANAIELHVDDSIALVLVDGARHDERPLRVTLAHGRSARLSLVGTDGRITERDIDRTSAGETLRVAAAPTASVSVPASKAPGPAKASTMPTTSTPPRSGSSAVPLWKSPY